MKKALLIIITALATNVAPAQFGNLLDRAKQKVKNKTNQKIDEKMDKAIDNTVDNAGKKSATANTRPSSNDNTATDDKSININTGMPTLKSYSKFDFVPGEKIVVAEDFAQDAVGDFPDKWNTNGSGEVVTADGQQGHWLMIRKKGRFIPEYITSLPENFTFQFDVLCNEKFNYYSNALQLYFLTGSNGKGALENSFIQMDKRSGVKLGVHPANAGSTGGTALVQSFEDGETVINNEVVTSQFNSNAGKIKLKVSLWRQKQRLRVYLNEEKVFDLPRAFAADKNYGTVLFELWSDMNNDLDRYLISNIKLAVGSPDTRNKLMNEGKFVTHGILFDVNSDKIKPESYGALKDIANVLTENTTVKVSITGHTDSDGDDKSNLELSKKRAESVKSILSKEFNIDASRMATDGKGESAPIDKNTSAEGKANNRRVEFIKQ